MSYEETFLEGYKLPMPLKQAEIAELYKRIEKGDKDAKDKIIIHNIRLVLYIVKKYTQYQAIEKDLVSIGLIGLIKGVNSFQLSKNVKFATYATRCIENEILMYLRKDKKHMGDISLEDSPLGVDPEGNELHLEDVLDDEEAQDDLESYENQDTMKKVREVVSTLPDKERQIIKKRFGFADNEIITQNELAEELGISQSYVSRYEKKILKKLKKQLNEKDIIEFSDKQLNKTNRVSSQMIVTNNEKAKIAIGGGTNFSKTKKKWTRRDYTSFYTYFSEYDKDLLDKVLEKTNERHLIILHTIWGEDLKCFNKDVMTPETKIFFRNNIRTGIETKAKKLQENNMQIQKTSQTNLIHKQIDESSISNILKKQESGIVNTIVDNFNYISTREQYASMPSLAAESKEKNIKKEFKMLTSVYDLYDGKYSKREMDIAISKLNEIDQETLKARFGEDFRHPVSLFEMDQKMRMQFFDKVMIQLYKFISNPDYIADTSYYDKKIEKQNFNEKFFIKEKKRIEKDPKTEEKMTSTQRKRRTKRDYTTIYTYFAAYDKELVDSVLKRTSEEHKKIFHVIWGENLNQLNEKALTLEIKNELRHKAGPTFETKIKRLQTKNEKKYLRRDYTSLYTYFNDYDKEIVDAVLKKTSEKHKEILYKIWGENLDQFNEEAFTPKMKKDFRYNVALSIEQKAKKLQNGTKTIYNRRDYSTLYTYFNNYDKKLVDEVLKNINEEHKKILHTIWGENLDQFNEEAFTPEMKKNFRNNIRVSIEQKAKKLQNGTKTIYNRRDYSTLYTYFSGYDKEIVDAVLKKTSEKHKEILYKIWGEDFNQLNEEAFTPEMKKVLRQNISLTFSKKANKLQVGMANIYNRRDYTTIYTYFKDYDKEFIDAVLKRTSEEHKKILHSIWGKDFYQLNEKALTSEIKKYSLCCICQNIEKKVKKIKALVEQADKKDYTTFYTYFNAYDKDLLNTILKKMKEQDKKILYSIWGEDLNQFNEEALTLEIKVFIYKNITRDLEKRMVQLQVRKENKNVDKRYKKDYTTIYTYFSAYDKVLVDEIFKRTREEHKEILYKIWGENLDQFNEGAFTPEIKNELMHRIGPNFETKAKKFKKKKEDKYLQRDYTTIYTYFSDYDKELVDEVLKNINEEYKKTFYEIWGEDFNQFNEEILTPEMKKMLAYNISSIFETEIKKLSKIKKNKYRKKDYTTFYTYFSNYDKELIDTVLKRTNEEHKKILHTIWGEDLNQFNEEAFTPEMKKILAYSISKTFEAKVKKLQVTIEKQKETKPIEDLSNFVETCSEERKENNNIAELKEEEQKEITKEGYVALAEMIQTDTFENLMKKVGKKEAFIVCLKMEKNSNEAIANFLEIPEEEVISTTKKILIQYKEQVLIEFDEKMDKAIDVIANNKMMIKTGKNNE